MFDRKSMEIQDIVMECEPQLLLRNIGRIVQYDFHYDIVKDDYDGMYVLVLINYYSNSSVYIDSVHSSEADAYRRVAEIKETLSIMTEMENEVIKD